MLDKVLQSLYGVECVSEYKFHPTRKWRFDYAIPSCKIAIEVEGGVWTRGRHTRPKGFIGDMEKYNEACALGWRVLRVEPKNINKVEFLGVVERAINKQ